MKTAAKLEAVPAADDHASADIARLAQALEDVAAAHAMGEASAEAVKDAAAALSAAQAAERAAAADRAADHAAAAGLLRRLQQAEAEVGQAREALEAASRAWLEAEMAAAESRYLQAVEATAQAHGRHAALAAALHRRGATLSNPITVALNPVLPTIGPASCAVYKDSRPDQHGMAANLVDVLMSTSNDPDAELAALINSSKKAA